jgi:DNA-binding MarR family transcriptional regulator
VANTEYPLIQIGLLLLRAHGRATALLNAALAPLDITGRHFGVMLLLDRDGVSTQRDLIRETGSDKAGMVRTVDDLEGRGWIARKPSPHDRRVADITLTTKGKAALRDGRESTQKPAGELFGDFTRAELVSLEGFLGRILDAGK